MNILGIETSCDETAVAWIELVDQQMMVRDSLVSSQIRLHERFGGVVPEIATREHLKNLPLLTKNIFKKNNLSAKTLDAIAVTSGPGLPTALLVGVSFAKALGVALRKPVYGINHLEGHLYSPFISMAPSEGLEMAIDPLSFPAVALLVSGGHTLLIHLRNWGDYHKLGGTVDDAAGEAFDKVARMMGLPYPGGPEIERWARGGDENAIEFPQSFPERDNFNFSFSGLKTSVRYFLEKNPSYRSEEKLKKNLCASFQKAVIDVLVRKSIRALQYTGSQNLILAGGVACNRVLRDQMKLQLQRNSLKLHLAESQFCTDNAAMIASIAGEKILQGIPPSLVGDFDPNFKISSLSS